MTAPRTVSSIARLYDSRWNRHYAAAKLRSDPLYRRRVGGQPFAFARYRLRHRSVGVFPS